MYHKMTTTRPALAATDKTIKPTQLQLRMTIATTTTMRPTVTKVTRLRHELIT
jgi:hypothetical protein